MTTKWPALQFGLKQHELMDEMIEKQGLDLLDVVTSGEGFTEARAKCRSCPDVCACRNWFLEGAETPAEFCPNLDFFAGLKREGG